MENNEKYIVEGIRSHREEIDLDGLWADVSPEIPKQKKRRKYGFWIVGGFAMILFLGIARIVITSNGSDNANASAIETLKEENDFQASNKVNKAGKSASLKENTASMNSQNTESIQSANNKQSAKDGTNSSNINNLRSESKNEALSPTDELKIKKSFKKTQADVNNARTPLNERKLTQDNILMHIPTSRKNANLSTESDKSNNKIIDRSQPFHTAKVILDAPSLLSDTKITLLSFDRANSELDLDLIKVENHIPKINRWSIYLASGAGFAQRKLTTKSIELQPELKRREAVVDVLGSWEIEGGIGFQLSPKFKLLTGLNYTQIHEKASFETGYFVDYEVQSENVINRQDGTIETQTDAVTGQGIRNSTQVQYNQLRLLQIPLKVTYEFLTLDKFKINIGALASYSFNQKYSGVTSFTTSNEGYDLNKDEENRFRKSGALTYGLFLEGITHLSKMVDLSFSLGYRQTNGINTEIYLIDQQYNSISFTSGISRRF